MVIILLWIDLLYQRTQFERPEERCFLILYIREDTTSMCNSYYIPLEYLVRNAIKIKIQEDERKKAGMNIER